MAAVGRRSAGAACAAAGTTGASAAADRMVLRDVCTPRPKPSRVNAGWRARHDSGPSTSRSFAANPSGSPAGWPYSPPEKPLCEPGNTTGSTPSCAATDRAPRAGHSWLDSAPDRDREPVAERPQGVEVRARRSGRWGCCGRSRWCGRRRPRSGRPNAAGSGAGRREPVRGELAVVHDEPDELRQPGPEPLLPVGLDHVLGDLVEHLAVGQVGDRRRLVGHGPRHVVGVRRDQRHQVHRSPAGAEAVDRPDAERLDDPVQVLRVVLRRDLGGAGRVAGRAARVVGDDGPVAEQRDDRAEARPRPSASRTRTAGVPEDRSPRTS